MKDLRKKFNDYIQNLDPDISSLTQDDADQLIQKATQLENNKEFSEDFEESSTKYKGLYPYLFQLVSTFPTVDPNIAWKALRTIPEVPHSDLTELSRATDNIDQDKAERWIHTHLPAIGKASEEKRDIKIEPITPPLVDDDDDIVGHDIINNIEKGKEAIQNASIAPNQKLADKYINDAQNYLEQAQNLLPTDEFDSKMFYAFHSSSIQELRDKINNTITELRKKYSVDNVESDSPKFVASDEPTDIGTSGEPTDIGTSSEPTAIGTSGEPTAIGTSGEPTAIGTSNKPAEIGTSNKPTDIDISDGSTSTIIPDIKNPREEYSDVYHEIDTLALSPEQSEEAKSYADVVLNAPADHPREYNALTGSDSVRRTKCIRSMLSTANNRLGYRAPVSRTPRDTLDFTSGIALQARNAANVRHALIMPSGFGLKRNAAMWNVPVITDFGFPFLNFSSDPMISIIQSNATDDSIKNSQLKQMFKDAAKRFGGIWKAIYSAPLSLIRTIASDVGIKCTPKYIKIDGHTLIDSEPGEKVSVTPIKYYSVETAYEPSLTVPRDYLTTFYDVIDYSSTSKRMYLKFADGMTDEEFAETIDEENGIPPFYILVPKTAKFSKCPIRSGSLFGSLLNVILGRKKCTMVKTIFQGKRGCLAMESETADALFAET